MFHAVQNNGASYWSPVFHRLLSLFASLLTGVSSFQGIPKLVEGNALLLGDALKGKGFAVTQPDVRHPRWLTAKAHFERLQYLEAQLL